MNAIVEQDRPSPPAHQQPNLPAHLFQRAPSRHINDGTVDIESSRAVAEVQASFVVAQRFPRDEALALDRFLTSCSRPSFAERAFFRYKRGGTNVEGPSIRFAEEAARCFRNFDYGMLELSNKDGVTEMQAFALDKEANVRSYQNFTVRHLRDKSSGPAQELTSERDIYEIGANMGSRRMRARILALLPADYVESGVERCKETLANRDASVPIADRIKAMLSAFSKVGVTGDMLVKRLGHPLDKTAPHELDDLRGVLTAIRENVTTVAEEFAADGGFHAQDSEGTGAAVAGIVGGKGGKAKASSTEPKASEEPKQPEKPKEEVKAESKKAPPAEPEKEQSEPEQEQPEAEQTHDPDTGEVFEEGPAEEDPF